MDGGVGEDAESGWQGGKYFRGEVLRIFSFGVDVEEEWAYVRL